MTWLSGNIVIDSLVKLKESGLEASHRRFYSKYSGRVETNQDPQQQGRVKISLAATGKVNIDKNTGQAIPETYELFSNPTSPFAGNNYGFYFPPETGDRVWVWFDHGDPSVANISGGMWSNSGAGNPKPANTSTIPVEFNAVSQPITLVAQTPVDPKNPVITTRGIKSPTGHGIVFEDDEIINYGMTKYGRETRVELWTGEEDVGSEAILAASTTLIGQIPPALPAIKHHQIILSDALNKITIQSFGKHSTIFDDWPLTQSITTKSTYGHILKFDDLLKNITFKTLLGHSYSASDITNQIIITTATNNTFINLSDPIIQVNGLNFNQTMLGLTSLASIGPTSIASAAAVTITGGALVSILGAGVNITSAGTAPCATIAGGISNNSFVGLVTEEYIGGLVQVIAGLQSTTAGIWNVTAPIAALLSPSIILGTGTQYFLVNQQFFDYYNTHTHAALGAPPDPAHQIKTPLNPGGTIPLNLVATQQIKAS